MVRLKNRYIVVHYDFNDKTNKYLSKDQLLNLIKEHVEKVHGDFGVGALINGLFVKYLNPNTQIALIRARLGPHKLVTTVLPLILSPIRLKSITTTATILQSFKFLRSHQLKLLEKHWNDMEKKSLNPQELKYFEALKNFNAFNKKALS